MILELVYPALALGMGYLFSTSKDAFEEMDKKEMSEKEINKQ